jgi:hypothetical protein
MGDEDRDGDSHGDPCGQGTAGDTSLRPAEKEPQTTERKSLK